MRKIADIIAERIVSSNPEVLGNREASGWWMELHDRSKSMQKMAYQKVYVGFGKNAEIVVACDLADSDELQVIGLQRHASLNEGDGMAFPYDPPRKVSFHMADVQFPIDIVFVGSDSRVSKIVEEAEPGTGDVWTMPHTALVVEVPGGYCRSAGIEVGHNVYEVDGMPHTAQETFNTEMTRPDINRKVQPSTPDVITYSNFKDRDLADVTTDAQPMSTHREETEGYDVSKDMSDEVSIVRPSR